MWVLQKEKPFLGRELRVSFPRWAGTVFLVVG
jgi:hypothetical protein